MAGYAVECGLKACVLVRLAAEPEQIFADRDFSRKCWTHDLEDLVKLAGLETILRADLAADPVLLQSWSFATEWSEESRYESRSHQDAKKLFQAIADKKHGVLSWIRTRW